MLCIKANSEISHVARQIDTAGKVRYCMPLPDQREVHPKLPEPLYLDFPRTSEAKLLISLVRLSSGKEPVA